MRDRSVSVIIVTHNSLPILRQCLECLQAAIATVAAEVIIVDNGSSDLSATVAAQLLPEARILTNRQNRGFAAAANQGAAIAANSFLLFLNPDMLIDADAVANLLRVYECGQPIGLVAGRTRSTDGSFLGNCRRFPTLKNIVFSRGSLISRLVPVGKNGMKYTLGDYPETTIVEAAGGMLVMIRRDLFHRLGGFDERFFMYMEDTDLSWRVQQAGFVNVFAPDAGGVHCWRQGSSTGKIRRLWYHHLSVWRYFGKQGTSVWQMIVLMPLLATNFLVSLVVPYSKAGSR